MDLGGGINNFFIENGNTPPKTSQIFASLLLKGGDGVDHFLFGGNMANATLRAVAKVTADGGAGTADTVTLGNATFVTPLIQLEYPLAGDQPACSALAPSLPIISKRA